MLARGAIRRLAADLSKLPKTSTHDLPRLSQLLRSGLLSHNGLSLPAARALSTAYNAALSQYRRSYATAARKTQPTARVKRDVKKAAAKKPAKKTATKASTRKTAKKPAAKRARAKPKKKAAKPGPKPRKEHTPEQKEKAKLAELKKKALRTPNTLSPVSAWNAYAAHLMTGAVGQPAGSTSAKMKEAAAQYKLLTPAEKEHWNHIANQSTATKRAEYEAWIRSFTPEQIRVANRARAALKKYQAAGKKLYMGPKYLKQLHDDRQIKMPGNSYSLFFKERQLSGDFKGIHGSEASKLIGNEWKALSASEKEKYKAESAGKRATYQQEKQKVYGHT